MFCSSFQFLPPAAGRTCGMPLASFLVLTGLSSLWTTVGEASCLPDSINASQRRNLTGYGESYPIGVLVSNWDASYVTSAVVHILLEDCFILYCSPSTRAVVM